MRNIRLRPIPGNEIDPRIAHLARHETTALMASDALRGLPCQAACDVVEAYFEALPLQMVDAGRLEDLANVLGRLAHEAARQKET